MTDTNNTLFAPPRPAFLRDGKGRIDSSLSNYVMALSPPYSAVVYRYGGQLGLLGCSPVNRPDEWYPLLDHPVVELRLHLERLGFKSVGKGKVVDAVKWLAHVNSQKRSA